MSANPSRSLAAWLEHLEQAHPLGIDLGLDRVAEVARRMGLHKTRLAPRVITVAGTNGKGSSVAMLDALARAHGLTTATYTSPHLLRYNERVRLNGCEVDDATLVAAFETVETARLSGDPVSLTYFEVGTLAALAIFAAHRPELVVLEVGLGGRLDAVNVIDADIAVITTIAHDHAAYLGGDLSVIGREKAGIMRSGCPAVLGSRDLPASVYQCAEERGAVTVTLGEEFHWETADSTKHFHWRGSGQHGNSLSLEELPNPGLPLDNAATALQALAASGLALDAQSCRGALQELGVPGRMQWLGQWCLDVGHNPHAAAYVAGCLAAQPCRGRTWVLLGMLNDKDADGVIEALSQVADAWVPVTLVAERGRAATELAECIEARGGRVAQRADSPEAGAEWLSSQLAPSDRVLVCGSFFTVAAILSWKQT